MPKETREELINYIKRIGLYDNKCDTFYNLPHEEKAKPEVFESFCKKKRGFFGIVLSDDSICDNKDLVLIAAKYGFYSAFHLLSERLLDDPDIALALADCGRGEYANISKRLRSDPDLMLKALRINPGIYLSLPVDLKIRREFVAEVAENYPGLLNRALAKVSKEHMERLHNDEELAVMIAKRNPRALADFFSSKILKSERVKSAVNAAFDFSNAKEYKKKLRENVWAFNYIDPKYWVDDRALTKAALHEDGELLRFLPESYRNDKAVALIAVKSSPYALEYCSESLRDDKEVVLAALQEDTENVLSYASERLRADYEVVYKAVKVDALNLEYASDELRDNRDIVMRAVKTYGGVLEDASERLQNDEELRKIARKTCDLYWLDERTV